MMIAGSDGIILPDYNPVNEFPLLRRGTGEIDPSGFNAVMSHKIGQQGNIIAFGKKIFGKPVAEAVGIHGRRRDVVLDCQLF